MDIGNFKRVENKIHYTTKCIGFLTTHGSFVCRTWSARRNSALSNRRKGLLEPTQCGICWKSGLLPCHRSFVEGTGQLPRSEWTSGFHIPKFVTMSLIFWARVDNPVEHIYLDPLIDVPFAQFLYDMPSTIMVGP